MQYLHILHGQNLDPTLGSSHDQLGAERVHDDDGFEDRSLALLPGLQEHFCFALIVTKYCGDLGWKTRTRYEIRMLHRFYSHKNLHEITNCSFQTSSGSKIVLISQTLI